MKFIVTIHERLANNGSYAICEKLNRRSSKMYKQTYYNFCKMNDSSFLVSNTHYIVNMGLNISAYERIDPLVETPKYA